jgi:hypothetical protein
MTPLCTLHSAHPLTNPSYDLPDDLFDKEKGDVKPTKAKKKTAVNGKKPALKRSFNEVEVSS